MFAAATQRMLQFCPIGDSGDMVMKYLLTFAVASLSLICTGCGGGDSHESLAGESLTTMKDLVATFETVKDEETAKAAKPKLKSLSDKMNALNERQAKLPAMTEADVNAIDKKYGKEMEEVQLKLASNVMRLGFDPKIRPVLDDIDLKGAK
jgi:hypothetical protein